MNQDSPISPPSTREGGEDTHGAPILGREGLFGGSFDPVHLGHLHAARAACTAFGLARVRFVPAARPPHKPGVSLAPGADRLAMLELALAREPGFEVWDVELARAGPSFTIDTVRQALEGPTADPERELCLILGGDNLRGLESWRAVDELLRLCQPIVIWRDARELDALEVLRKRMDPELVARIERGLLPLPPVLVSASEIRAAFARGEHPAQLLPPGVGEYVREHGLYGTA